MTKEEALYSFFSGFGIDAYSDTAVPDDCTFPWLTYDIKTAAFGDAPVSLNVNVWYYGTSELDISDKVKEISERIGRGGITLPCDDGFVWLNRGSPWCSAIRDDRDKNIKRRFLNVTAEYFTDF